MQSCLQGTEVQCSQPCVCLVFHAAHLLQGKHIHTQATHLQQSCSLQAVRHLLSRQHLHVNRLQQKSLQHALLQAAATPLTESAGRLLTLSC